MTAGNWIEISRIIVDLFKTIIPFVVIFFIIGMFKEEIKKLIHSGGLRVSAPGFSLETVQPQQEKVGTKEQKEIQELNSELQTAKQMQQKLRELQEYTVRDKDTLFLRYHFERTYRLIFPSQMKILEVMSNSNNEITEDLTNAFFRRTIWAQKFNISIKQLDNFLIQSGLVFYDSSGRKFTLAPVGKAFLEYIKKENIPSKPLNDVIEQ